MRRILGSETLKEPMARFHTHKRREWTDVVSTFLHHSVCLREEPPGCVLAGDQKLMDQQAKFFRAGKVDDFTRLHSIVARRPMFFTVNDETDRLWLKEREAIRHLIFGLLLPDMFPEPSPWEDLGACPPGTLL